MRLKDKVAVVTGSGRGIGEATVTRFAEEGAKVVVSDRYDERTQQVAGALRQRGFEALAISADVAQREDVQKLIDGAVEKFGRLDILVNNAGFPKDALIGKMSEETWDAVINVNLKGTFTCCQAAAKYMIEQKYGKIVNLSSRAYLGNPGQANYSAAKAGIVGLTKALAKELGRYNIYVNCVAPGVIDTPGLREVLQEKYLQLAIDSSPLKKIGTPLDVANTILFLASDECTFITGEVLHITGGRYG